MVSMNFRFKLAFSLLLLHNSSTHAATDLEYGVAIGSFLYAGRILEVATTGECGKFVKNHHKFSNDLTTALEITPERLHQSIRQLYINDLSQIDQEINKVIQSIQSLSKSTSAEYMCGMKFGAAASLYNSAITSAAFIQIKSEAESRRK